MIGLTFPLPALFALMTPAPSAEPAMQAPVAFRHVVFSHGQESGPWGRKISALAEVARSGGYAAHSVDFCKALTGDLGLVGSSPGGYIPATSSWLLHARATVRLAPATYTQWRP